MDNFSFPFLLQRKKENKKWFIVVDCNTELTSHPPFALKYKQLVLLLFDKGE
jgi:hypothetical protein